MGNISTQRRTPRSFETPGVLRALRNLAPNRRLRPTEARNLAELQAARFLELNNSSYAEPVSIRTVAELPHIRLSDDPTLPIAGTSHWDSEHREWVIRLSPTYSGPQRRFTLLHEFKHIIDFRAGSDQPDAHRSHCDDHVAEQVADQFAACVLLPKRAVRHAWGLTARSARAIAARFDVPEGVAQMRVEQLGLLPPSRSYQPSRDDPIEVRS